MKQRLFKLLFLVAVAIVSQACSQELPAEESCHYVLNSSHRRVSWNQLPVKFYVDSGITDRDTYQAIKDAAATWNEAFQDHRGEDAIEVLGRTEQLNFPGASGEPPKDGYNAVYLVPDGVGFSDSEQARTALHYKGDDIHEADIVINGRLDFFFGESGSEAGEGKVEIESLMIHEFGHTLGLDHIDTDEDGEFVASVMETRLAFNEARRTLQPSELSALQCEY